MERAIAMLLEMPRWRLALGTIIVAQSLGLAGVVVSDASALIEIPLALTYLAGGYLTVTALRARR